MCVWQDTLTLFFEIQGSVEVGNERNVGMSVSQDNRFIVLKTFWVEKKESLSCILTGFCLLAYKILSSVYYHPG